jgi:ribosomal protein S18 acetylase RimI-like enzyme
MSLKIRHAQLDDAEYLHRVVLEAFEEYRGAVPVPPSALNETLEEVRREISAGRVLVAVDGRDVAGTVRYEVEPDVLYVGRLAVLPSQRGRGVGATLMAYVEELAPALGRTRIRLGTRESMPGNIRFYERLGYTIVEREPHTRGPDTIVWFEKELGGRP